MRGQELNVERWEYVQATVYLSSGMQFEWKQNKPECNQRTVECEGRVLWENITKSEHATGKSRGVQDKKNKDLRMGKIRDLLMLSHLICTLDTYGTFISY